MPSTSITRTTIDADERPVSRDQVGSNERQELNAKNNSSQVSATMPRTLRHPDVAPSHPGAIVAEVIEDAGLNKTALAESLGVTRAALYNVIEERSAVSADMAVKIETAMGISADLLVSMQAACDLHKARKAAASATERTADPVRIASVRTRGVGDAGMRRTGSATGKLARDAASGRFGDKKSTAASEPAQTSTGKGKK